MKTLAQRCTQIAVLAMLARLATSAGHASPSSPPSPSPPASKPARALPWLEVKLPPAPAASAAKGRFDIVLDVGNKLVPADFAGVKLSVGGAAPRTVRLGERVRLPIAAHPTQPFRLEVGGMRMLAHVLPGDDLAIRSGHDGGWVASIGNRMNENAPKNLTLCDGPARKGECPADYTSTHVWKEDPVCPPGTDDERVYKCVKAPVVRARGPLTGKAEAIAHNPASLAPTPLAANALGPPVPVLIDREVMPRIQLGNAEAMLVIGPGDSYEVWLDDKGQVDSKRVK